MALAGIAVVMVASLRLGNVGWLHIGLFVAFIPTIVTVVLHGQKDRLDAQRALRHQATHDPLTGLPNRVLFRERLASMEAEPGDCPFALALLDLDGFKAINDQHGHLTGDALLQAVAERLRDNIRTHDMVARFGGDEFALIFGGVTNPPALLERCHQLRERLAKPYHLTGHDGSVIARVSASIGIAVGSGPHAERLIQAADKALYRAKAAGKNGCVLTEARQVVFITHSQGGSMEHT